MMKNKRFLIKMESGNFDIFLKYNDFIHFKIIQQI
jgi:hypothetical protein